MRFSGSVHLRPVRIGFLVAPNDLSTIRRIMHLCNCVWGGRYNPIIPFFEDTPSRWIAPHQQVSGLDIARGFVDFFEPDVLIETSPGMGDKLGWWSHKRSSFELPRLLSLDDFFEVNHYKQIIFAAGHSVFDVIAHLYDQEYKYQRRHKRPFALFEVGEEETFYDLFGGRYPNDEPLKYIADAYREVFEPEVLSASSSSFLKFLKDGNTGPSWITRHSLKESSGHRRDPTIFVLDPQDR